MSGSICIRIKTVTVLSLIWSHHVMLTASVDGDGLYLLMNNLLSCVSQWFTVISFPEMLPMQISPFHSSPSIWAMEC